MKQKLVLLCFLFPFTTLAQQWAEIGSKWYYDSMDNGSSPPSSSYFLFESKKDTLINSITCKKIEVTLFSKKYGIVERVPEYMYSDSGRVYYFWNNDFKLLYDFSANTGDTFQVFNRLIPDTNPNNITDFRVDSTKLFKDAFGNLSSYGIDSFKVQYIRAVSNNGYELSFGYNTIIENIGSIDLMFPTPSTTIPEKDGPLRCFQNDSLWLKAFPQSCDYWVTSINEIIGNNQISISPNPSNGIFNLFFTNSTIQPSGCLTIYNFLGEIIFNAEYKNELSKIDISSHPQGIYLFISNINGKIQTFKIIKI